MQAISDLIPKLNFAPCLDKVYRNRYGICNSRSIPVLCAGISFTYRDFKLELDIKKPQWDDNCSLITLSHFSLKGEGEENVCEYCRVIKTHNLRTIRHYYTSIKDFSKISFDRSGLIQLNEALKEIEKESPPKKQEKVDSYPYHDNVYTNIAKYAATMAKNADMEKVKFYDYKNIPFDE